MNEISQEIISSVFDGEQKIEHNVSSFTELTLLQCREFLKWNGYKNYVNNGFLTAKK